MITEFKNYGILKITILKLKSYDIIHKMENLKSLFFTYKVLLLHRRPPYRRSVPIAIGIGREESPDTIEKHSG